MSTISTGNDFYSSLGLGAAASTAVEKSKNDALGQADFLLLMTTQLQNQDPLKPMDNAEMVSQLAQMSTVQGIETLNKTASGFASSMTNDQILKASSLVGHEVLIPSSTWALGSEGEAKGVIAAQGPGTLTVDIHDSNGNLVQTVHQKTDGAGELAFQWDGRNSSGDRLPAGKYTLNARFSTGGREEAVQTYIQAPVDSVTIGNNSLYLNLKDLGATPLDQVLRVS